MSNRPVRDKNAASNQRPSDDERNPSPRRPLKFMGDANWWMVWLTIGVGVISVAQWYTAKQTMEVSNRAYVLATTADIYVNPKQGEIGKAERLYEGGKSNLVEGAGLTVQVTIANTGHSPAMNLRISGVVEIRANYPNRDTFRVYADPPEGNTLANGEEIFIAMPLKRPVTAADVTQVRGGLIHLIAHGRIEYDDVFADHHITEFCFVSSINSSMDHCPQLNRAN
jgi:hypothetical protein